MIKRFFSITLIALIIFSFGLRLKSETEFEFYLKDFLNKNNKAIEILKELEINLKNGSRKKSCSRQKEAARIGLLANESLLKAYKLIGEIPPKETIELNKMRWKSIMENC